MAKKSFSELTERGQKQRLAKYEAERAQRGTQEALVRLVRPASFKDLKDGNRLAVFRLAKFDKVDNETKFFTATAFIKKGKEALEAWYASLPKGALVSVEFKENNGYTNIWSMIDRQYADTRSNKNGSQIQMEEEQELEA